MLAQSHDTLVDLRADHEALCALLIEGGVISAERLARERNLHNPRACRLPCIFDVSRITLTATRFMTVDDFAAVRTTSKNTAHSMAGVPAAVLPSMVLAADSDGSAGLFDTLFGRWEALPNLREGREDPVSVVIRGRVYVCGGFVADTGCASRSVECFDPRRKRWRSLRPMSVPRRRAAAAVVGDHLYVCGGDSFDSDDEGMVHDSAERLDASSEVWEALPAMTQRRTGAGAAAIRDRIYVVGGLAGHSLKSTNSVERFGVEWATLPPMTLPRRGGCSTTVIANKLYVSGGEGDGNVPTTVERFHPALGFWELLRPMLHRRWFATTAVLRGRLYVCGGTDDRYEGAFSSVECYDPDTDSWEKSAPMLRARFRAKATRCNGCLYVFGGCGARGILRLAERFDPVTGRWEGLSSMPIEEVSLVAAAHA